MAIKHGRNTAVWFNSTDLSTFLRSAGMDLTGETADVTTFQSGGWKKHISGLLAGTFPFEGVYDASSTGADALIQAALAADNGVLTYCPGGYSIGDLARLAPITGTSFAVVSTKDDTVTFTWDALSEGAIYFGQILHAFGEDTNTTTGPTKDDGAATTDGWTAQIHCSLVDGGSWVVKLEDSANGSAWSDVSGGAFTALTAAGTQRLQSADGATLRRYVRCTATRTGGSSGQGITYGLSYARRK